MSAIFIALSTCNIPIRLREESPFQILRPRTLIASMFIIAVLRCGGEEMRRCVMWRVEVMLGEARNTDYA